MWRTRISTFLRRFRDDTRGTATMEAAITMPFLAWVMVLMFVFFDVYRFNSIRDKATYTTADMITREMQTIDESYLTNAKTVFDAIAGDGERNQLRFTVIKYDADNDEYTVKWSRVRGTGDLTPWTDADAEARRDRLPILTDGEEVLLVDSVSRYFTPFEMPGDEILDVETRVFASPRFVPQIVLDG
ncbi:TadE/TadG family type IV pilus assembly protein [Roseovarius salinarum]|uniref:TadE/TadG family type IV pilus assembly protein n=1 Tax=Roseovarius salinarum TaxID=1981892 RepID=UPI000C33B66A|nr:hypothetical protein [Roseovarius salinarum]